MKVYYEKPKITAENLIEDIINLAARYEEITGKSANKLVLTREEFIILDKHLSKYLLRNEKTTDLRFAGMKIEVEQ